MSDSVGLIDSDSLKPTTLGALAEYITSGSRDWSKYYAKSGAIFIRTQDINRNRLSLDDVAYVALPERVEGKRSLVKKGDLLITITGANVGKVAAVDFDPPEAYVSQSVCLVRLKDPKIAKFVQMQLIARKGDKSSLESMAYGLGRPVLNLENIRSAPVLVGTVEQQNEIVAELEKQFSRLDEAVANLQRVKANLKRYKASVLKAAVEGRLVETEATLARREDRTYEAGEQLLRAALIARRAKWDRRGQYVEPKATAADELPSLPDGWVWANVEQLGFVRGGKRLPAGHKYAEEVTPHPYIRVTDFTDYGIKLDGLLYLKPETHKEIQRYTISSDDLYISIAGSIGLVGVLPERLSGANLTENAAKITGLEHVQKEYLMYWLSSASGIDFISDSTIATTQAKLALYRIERIPVPLPPLAEQARIVAEVDRHLSIIREVEAEVDTNLQRAQSLRQATLAKAFTVQSGLLHG